MYVQYPQSFLTFLSKCKSKNIWIGEVGKPAKKPMLGGNILNIYICETRDKNYYDFYLHAYCNFYFYKHCNSYFDAYHLCFFGDKSACL